MSPERELAERVLKDWDTRQDDEHGLGEKVILARAYLALLDSANTARVALLTEIILELQMRRGKSESTAGADRQGGSARPL